MIWEYVVIGGVVCVPGAWAIESVIRWVLDGSDAQEVTSRG